jgi:hypothetical protein
MNADAEAQLRAADSRIASLKENLEIARRSIVVLLARYQKENCIRRAMGRALDSVTGARTVEEAKEAARRVQAVIAQYNEPEVV